jgi:hypothetical protein
MNSKLFSPIIIGALLLVLLCPEKTIQQVVQGRFRLTLTGFVVNNQTSDNILQSDGKGDEVYALVNFGEIWSTNRIFGALQRRQSLVYGDPTGFPHAPGSHLHPGETGPVQAGSAGTSGGLVTGNRYPPPEGPATRPTASAATQARMLPMILWEGDLRRGGPQANAVLIMPTIWESDYAPDVLDIWNRQADNFIRRFATNSSRFFSESSRRPLVEQADIVLSTIPQRNDFDRPIGMSGDTYNPIAASPNPATFTPAVMLLTFDSAEAAANSTTQGRGVIEITYRDGQNYGPGSYTIFLRLQRLP